MIKFSTVKTLDDHLAGVTKIFQDLNSFLIYAMSIVVLSHCAIVGIGEFASDITIIEKVIYVDHIDVATLI